MPLASLRGMANPLSLGVQAHQAIKKKKLHPSTIYIPFNISNEVLHTKWSHTGYDIKWGPTGYDIKWSTTGYDIKWSHTGYDIKWGHWL